MMKFNDENETLYARIDTLRSSGMSVFAIAEKLALPVDQVRDIIEELDDEEYHFEYDVNLENRFREFM